MQRFAIVGGLWSALYAVAWCGARRPFVIREANDRAWSVRRFCAAVVLLVVVGITGCRGDDSATVQGGCQPGSSPYLRDDPQARDARITYCESGDGHVGGIESSPFPAGTRDIQILVAGYPDGGPVRLEARAVGGGRSTLIDVKQAGDRWQLLNIDIPKRVSETAFRLHAVDASTAQFGWIGIGFPASTPLDPILRIAVHMLLVICAGHAWLCLVAYAFPRRWSPGWRLIGAQLILGGVSVVLFFAHLGLSSLAAILTWALLLAPLSALVFRPPLQRAEVTSLLQISSVALPGVVLALMVLWAGLYPFSGDGEDWRVAALRWRDMPPDNWLPYALASMARGGSVVTPFFGDWLSSDRPPLQAGLSLLFRRIWETSPGFAYQAISTWAQTLFLVPVAMLIPRSVTRWMRVVVVMSIGLSALVLLNSFFVWPKLFAAAYCAIFHLALFNGGRDRRGWSIAAAACALAMLAHGGALFALAGSAFAFLLVERAQAISVLARTVGAGLLAYLPWVGYQRFVDPPGDRLLKWHFAGQPAIVDTSFLRVLADAYAAKGWPDLLRDRLDNIRMLMDKSLKFPVDAAGLVSDTTSDASAKAIVGDSFFHLFYSGWFFSPWVALVAAAFLLLRRDAAVAGIPRGAVPAISTGLAFWCLLMFVPYSTGIHQGAYFTFILLHLVTMLLVARVSAALLCILAVLNVSIAIRVYVFDRSIDALPHVTTYAAVAILLILLFLLTLAGRFSRVPDNDSFPIPNGNPL